MTKAFGRKRADLADLHPGGFEKEFIGKRVRQGKSGSLWLARDRKSDDGAGVAVEKFVTDHQDRTPSGLFSASCWFQVGPIDVAS